MRPVQILRGAQQFVIKSKRGVARDEAIDLAEYLTAKGFRYFDDLLDEMSESH
jgi:hypothetical protein